MPQPKRIVLFVEGESDEVALPFLAARLLNDWGIWEAFIDDRPFLVGSVENVMNENGRDWRNYLKRAAKRPNLGAVLLVLDGDIDPVGKEKEPFCAARMASRLAEWSAEAGGGSLFSVACVFARQELESWFLPCLNQLAGLRLADGRAGVRAGTECPIGDLELAPRNAKGLLNSVMETGYKALRDIVPLARVAVNYFDAVRNRPMRSYLRFEHALKELTDAIHSGRHVFSPVWPRPSENLPRSSADMTATRQDSN